jgi:flagellar basal-body rod modification protein FlgD
VPIDITTTAPASPFAPAATPVRTPSNQLGKDAFLQLLVAQLKYQNPMEPTDSSQFMAQTAQFTMVEKLEEIARSTAAAQADGRSLSAAAMVGRTVAYLDADGVEQTGTVTTARLGTAGPTLTVNGKPVSFDAVTEVRQPTP